MMNSKSHPLKPETKFLLRFSFAMHKGSGNHVLTSKGVMGAPTLRYFNYKESTMSNPLNQNAKACIDACNACATECDSCAKHMADKDSKNDCPACCVECAAICRLCADAIARNSPFAKQICKLCADICTWCAKECDAQGMDHCKSCAEACRHCAEACRKMAA